MTSTQVLSHYDPAKPLTMSCDASPYGIAAVLSHRMPNGDDRPIAFASKTLTPAERNYCHLEKEALAIIFGVLFWTSFYHSNGSQTIIRFNRRKERYSS